MAALALVVDPESRPRIDATRLSLLLGLSSSEARVSALLAEGRPVREIAATTGYKESSILMEYRSAMFPGSATVTMRAESDTRFRFPPALSGFSWDCHSTARQAGGPRPG